MIDIEITKEKTVKVSGIDNYRKPRQEFADRLHAKSDKEYLHDVETIIWLAAFVMNNPQSDYHWQVDVCISEAKARGKPELYAKALEAAKASCS